MRINSSSGALGILQGLPSFNARGVVPGAVPLEPTDTLLGVLAFEKKVAVVLLDAGAYLPMEDDWQFASYADIAVILPPGDAPGSPLVLVTPHGRVEIPAGAGDAQDVGRFFMKCAEDAGTT